MTRNNITTFSHDNEFQLSVEIAIPEGNPRGIILFIPGVYETKEQYRDCYEYFTREQFICASYDHRGTGQSVRIEDEIGYLGKNAQKELSEDIRSVIDALSRLYAGLSVFLITCDYSSLITINFLRNDDDRIRALAFLSPVSVFPGLKRGRFLLQYTSILVPTYFKSERLNKKFYKRVHKMNASTLPFQYAVKSLFDLYDVAYRIEKDKLYYMKKPNLPIFIGVGMKDPARSYGSDLKSVLNRIGYHNVDYRTYSESNHLLLSGEEKEKILHDLLLFFTLSL